MNVYLHSAILLLFFGGGLLLTGQFYNFLGISLVVGLAFTATFFIKVINLWQIYVSEDGKLLGIEFYFKKINKNLYTPVEDINLVNFKFYPRYTVIEIIDNNNNLITTAIQINSFELKKVFKLLDEYKIKYKKIHPFG